MGDIAADLLETWKLHDCINHYLLDQLSIEALHAHPPFGGWNAAVEFAHLHNNRQLWLQSAAPEAATSIPRFPLKTRTEQAAITHEALHQALRASAQAIAEVLQKGFADGRVKGYRPHAAAFFAYLIAHEAHHRGEIGIIVKQAGHPLSNEASYKLWEWNSFRD